MVSSEGILGSLVYFAIIVCVPFVIYIIQVREFVCLNIHVC